MGIAQTISIDRGPELRMVHALQVSEPDRFRTTSGAMRELIRRGYGVWISEQGSSPELERPSLAGQIDSDLAIDDDDKAHAGGLDDTRDDGAPTPDDAQRPHA